MATLRGVLLVVFITMLAGAIAYVGDRVGHVVGRRRLSLFGLRPRHTSTIFAIGTGMLIALAVTVSALVASTYVQTAFFRLGELNSQIARLQDQASALDRHTHDENVVVNRNDLMSGGALLLQPQQTGVMRYTALAKFFDDTVRSVNSAYGPRELGTRALKSYPVRADDKAVAAKLHQVLDEIAPTLAKTPVLVLAIADRNLFPHDQIQFRLTGLADKRIFRRHAVIASLALSGRGINAQLAINQLAAMTGAQAVAHGLPSYFATPLSVTSGAQLREISNRLARGGNSVLVAQAATDIYPHLGGLPVEFMLMPRAK